MNSNNNHQFQVRIKVIEAHGLSKKDSKSQSDPFVVAKLKGIKQMMSSVKSSVVMNNPNPIWNQELDLFVPSVNDVLLLKVYDKDQIKNQLLGRVEVPLSQFFQAGPSDQWLQLMNRKGGWKQLIGKAPIWFTVPGSLHIQLWFGNTGAAFNGFGQSNVGPFNNSSMNNSTPLMNNSTPLMNNSTPMNSAPLMNNQTPMVDNSMNGQTPFNNQTSLNSQTPLMNNSVPVLSTPPIAPINDANLESPNYHSAEWSSKESETGFQPVNPGKFQWYNNTTTAL